MVATTTTTTTNGSSHHGATTTVDARDAPILTVREAVSAVHPGHRRTGRLDERSRRRRRFSDLLLEHGERHVQDWAVVASSASEDGGTATGPLPPERPSSASMGRVEGRVRLCTRSVVFEPTDPSRGIVRCPFAKSDAAPSRDGRAFARRRRAEKEERRRCSASSGVVVHDNARDDNDDDDDSRSQERTVYVDSDRHLLMKENNVVAPFETVPYPVSFRFVFQHSSPELFFELADTLFRVVRSVDGAPSPPVSPRVRELLDRASAPFSRARPFDPSRRADVRESPATPSLRCRRQTPLSSRLGCALVTDERLYFVPAPEGVLDEGEGTLGGGGGETEHWSLEEVVGVARRYDGLRDRAVELFFSKGRASLLLAFETPRDRDRVVRAMPPRAPVHTDRAFVERAAAEWRSGALSNYEYLAALNSAAGRTFHDLSRYPVAPWVIADYESAELNLTVDATFRDLSKPVGALDERRLAYFRKRCQSMTTEMEHPFLYGTHYSAPGYVLYYLVRDLPEHMLCLQNGRFDAPDRLFHDVPTCFASVLTNHADVKELVPEFYDVGARHAHDFLLNARGLPLGTTQNGERVHDVALPPWARSARDFVTKNRRALESDKCSARLHQWIDLVFGVKSRGEEARRADNLFHPSAYATPADLEAATTEEERARAELRATEFGVVPDQLFDEPHPPRFGGGSDDEASWERFVSRKLDARAAPSGATWEHHDADEGRSEETSAARGDAWGAGSRRASASTEHDTKRDDEQRARPRTSDVAVVREPKKEESASSFQGRLGNVTQQSLPPSSSNTLRGVRRTTQTHNRKPSPYSSSSSRRIPPASNQSAKPTTATIKPDRGGVARRYGGAPNYRTNDDDDDYENYVVPNATQSGWTLRSLVHQRIHDDAVTGCAWFVEDHDETSSSESCLATVSLDGFLLIHVLDATDDASRRSVPSAPRRRRRLRPRRAHKSSDRLACLSVVSDHRREHVAFAGGHDDLVVAYGVGSGCAAASLRAHHDAVTGAVVSPRDAFEGLLARDSASTTHVLITGSRDATVALRSVAVGAGETVSIRREPVAECSDADATAVVDVAVVATTDGAALAVGCQDGSFWVWTIERRDGTIALAHREPPRTGTGACATVAWSTSNDGAESWLFAGFATGKLASYRLSDGALIPIMRVSLGSPVRCAVVTNNVLLAGCADGDLRLLRIDSNGFFDADPIVWSAVNGSSSPGLSSVYVHSLNARANSMTCVTGGDDGSVSVFELERTL